MFMLSRETIHGGLACVFAASNVLLGVIGFCVAFSLIKQGKELLATSLWVWSYVVMIGILGFGYRRFLYAGTEEEWAAGVPYDLLDWAWITCLLHVTRHGRFRSAAPVLGFPLLANGGWLHLEAG
jgi:hypothetical protein